MGYLIGAPKTELKRQLIKISEKAPLVPTYEWLRGKQRYLGGFYTRGGKRFAITYPSAEGIGGRVNILAKYIKKLNPEEHLTEAVNIPKGIAPKSLSLVRLDMGKTLSDAFLSPGGRYHYIEKLGESHRSYGSALLEQNFIRKSTTGGITYEVNKLDKKVIDVINNDLISIAQIDDRGFQLGVVSEGKSYEVPEGALERNDFDVSKAINDSLTEVYDDPGSMFGVEAVASTEAIKAKWEAADVEIAGKPELASKADGKRYLI